MSEIDWNWSVYLTPVSGALSLLLPVEDVFRRTAVHRVALKIGTEPASRVVVEEALRLLEPLALEPGQAGVGQLGIQVVEELMIINCGNGVCSI